MIPALCARVFGLGRLVIPALCARVFGLGRLVIPALRARVLGLVGYRLTTFTASTVPSA